MKKRVFTILTGLALLALLTFNHSRNTTNSKPNEDPARAVKSTELTDGDLPVAESQDNKRLSSASNEIYPGEIHLFKATGQEGAAWSSKTPAAHRARSVMPDPAVLTPIPSLKEGDRLSAAFFDDAILKGKISDVTVYPNGAVGMTAQLDGEFNGTLYLAYSEGQLRVSADVFGGNDYYIRYDPDHQEHYAVEVDREASDYLIDCECPKPEPGKILSDDSAGDIVPVEQDAPPKIAGDSPSDAVVVDVMIVYTPNAETAAGGTSGINNNIALAMQKANEVHGNSDTKITLNLVYSAETVYTESGSPSLDLLRLTYTGTTNTAMDEVQGWRNSYSADMICLLEDNPGTGGLGWLLNSVNGKPDFAFCIARVQQSDWTYTVVHEWGHNMGCSHSKTQTQSPWEVGDLFDYSAGWQWSDTASSASIGYCSIMTYQNFNGSGGNEYERVPHFSNPNINYTGNSTNPTGHVNDGDNARTIRNVRFAVSDYRISASVITNFPFTNSFEYGFSPWRYYEGTTDWEREDGTDANLVSNYPNIATTNAADGTYFLMTDGLSASSGDSALLEATFDFGALGEPQLQFSYCMYSVNGFEAVTSMQASTNNGVSWATHWSNSGEPDNAWRQATVNLGPYAGMTNVQIQFKTDIGATWYKNYACLDLISIIDLSPPVNLDADGDGIPDAWETLYFGGPTNAIAGANPDGDLYTNLEEYIAGLNPTVTDSLLLTNFVAGSSSWFEWTAASNRLYRVYWSSNLLSGFSLMESNLISGAFTDTVHTTESSGFYKLEVEVAP